MPTCETCKQYDHDANRAHQQQCLKYGVPTWLAWQEPHLCDLGAQYEPIQAPKEGE